MRRACEIISIIGVIALVAIMLLIDANIFYRLTGRIIRGTYELVELLTAVCVGFSLLGAELRRSYVKVDLLTSVAPYSLNKVWHYISQVLSIGYWALMAYGMMKIVLDKIRLGEVTHTLKISVIPFRLLWIAALLLVIFIIIAYNFQYTAREERDK